MSGFLATAVEKGITKDFIDQARRFWDDKCRVNAVTRSQIRSVFNSVKRMEMQGDPNTPELQLLRARLAYAVVRTEKRNKKNYREFAEIIEGGINAVGEGEDTKERFRRFCQGFEAILAYHRAADGK